MTSGEGVNGRSLFLSRADRDFLEVMTRWPKGGKEDHENQ